jgi:3-dehydroquinate synthase
MGLIKEIEADLDGVPYPIYIGEGVIDSVVEYVQKKTKNKKIIIITYEFFAEELAQTVQNLFDSDGFFTFCHIMHAGKGNKNINEVLKIYSILEENDFARDSTLIAIGGGVIGDLSGFVASTWLRGMNLIHIPTSLMAMIDSSIGGKTAINFRHTINGIGSYYHPIANIIDLSLIKSLSDRDYNAGLAEVIKCAIINDNLFYNWLESNHELIQSRDFSGIIEFLSKTIEVKIKHVEGDVKEGSKRLLLNYGHTLGHSIEISTTKNGHEQLRHGEGVSVGIAAVAFLATQYLNLDPSIYRSIKSLLLRYNLPIDISASSLGFDRDKLLSACLKNVNKDKKRLNNKLRLILATEIGCASVFSDVPFEFVENAFNEIIKE